MILDDFDARPGSATSLLRTVVGLYLRDVGGWVAASDVVDLLGALDVAPAGARSALSRVKSKGLLVPELVDGRAGYRLAPDAVPMLERGDRRIFSYRRQADDDPWCLVSYSLPEARRDARHQLRRHLGAIGAGTVADGLWIAPGHLVDEVEQMLLALGVRDAATVFVTGPPRVSGSLADAAAQWWDLDGIAARHREFLARHDDGARLDDARPDGGARRERDASRDDAGAAGDAANPADDDASLADAFARWVRAVDDWRLIPYVDPGLPPSALPRDWPGTTGVALFDALRKVLAAPAREYVRTLVR